MVLKRCFCLVLSLFVCCPSVFVVVPRVVGFRFVVLFLFVDLFVGLVTRDHATSACFPCVLLVVAGCSFRVGFVVSCFSFTDYLL